MSWTDERVELLRKLWMDGLSASQIAAELGGVTRNAVIGKVHRLGLSGRAKSSSPQNVNRQKRVARPSPAAQPARPARSGQRSLSEPQMVVRAEIGDMASAPQNLTAPEPLRLDLTQLGESTCKWPIGDPATEDFYFCGHNSKDSGPYCAYHARVAYQPVTDRRRERRA
ncbi:MAG: GcrA family cell cycle regulator [Nitratireductor sp.]|nr:GcrA cell cycle regulator [Nitratireductor sp.]